jgi:hypothetical protein
LASEYKRLLKYHQTLTVSIKKLDNTRITIQSRTYQSLTYGKCGFVFNSRDFIEVHKKYQQRKKLLITYAARVKEAVVIMRKVKADVVRQRTKCFCEVKKTRDTLWSYVGSKARREHLMKAHLKCKRVYCLEKNIPLNSHTCRSNLPRLVNKKLTTKLTVTCPKTQHRRVTYRL